MIDKRFVAEKAKGKNNTQSAMTAIPTDNKNYAAVAGKRMADKPVVQSALDMALIKEDITIERAIKPISEALIANKQGFDKDNGDFYDTETPDHAIRLKAADMALKLLQAKPTKPEDNQPTINPQLQQAIKDGNIQEIQRVIFNEPSPEPQPPINDNI